MDQSKYYDIIKKELTEEECNILNRIPDAFKSLALLRLVQIHRFHTYKIFEYYRDRFSLQKLATNMLRFLTLSAYEWYSLLPILIHPESKHVCELYKLLVCEIILKDELKYTRGWGNLYIRTVLHLWALSPNPKWKPDDRDKLIFEQPYNKVQDLIHPLSAIYHGGTKIESSTYNHANKYERFYRLPKFAKCPYCLCKEECMASQNVNENGACGNSNAPFRCHIDSGVHLCSTHGQKIISYKDGDEFRLDAKEKLTLVLNDGRHVGYLGWLRFRSKEDKELWPRNGWQPTFGLVEFADVLNLNSLDHLYSDEVEEEEIKIKTDNIYRIHSS